MGPSGPGKIGLHSIGDAVDERRRRMSWPIGQGIMLESIKVKPREFEVDEDVVIVAVDVNPVHIMQMPECYANDKI